MKVNLVTSIPLAPPWDQGDKNLAYNLTRALPHIRFQVLTDRQAAPPVGENLERQPLYAGRVPSLWQKAGIILRLAGRTLPLLRDQGVDLYHLFFQPTRLASGILRNLPDLRRKPVVQTIPAIADAGSLDPRLFFGDRVIVASEYARQALVALGMNRVHHIPTGIVSADWQDLQGREQALKRELGLGSGPLILYTGHFDPGYGLETLVAAMPRVLNQFPQAQFVLACRPRTELARQAEIQVRQRLENLGLSRQVHIMHVVPDMRKLIGASDLVALPFETMRHKVDIPTTLLEALAAGKPVLISDLAPMNELIHLEGARLHPRSVGMAVPVGDACALAEAAVEIIGHAGLREELGRRGKALVAERFDIHHSAAAYEAIYTELTQ